MIPPDRRIGRSLPLPFEPMDILKTLTLIDAAYDPDPTGVIDAIGTTGDGRKVDLWIYNTGDGPIVEPGASFLPYGGIYYNPWPLVSIRAL